MLKNIVTLFIYLVFYINYSQTTYYVDNTNGNDANNGISTTTAWQTITKINNQSFIAGDIILFKKGEVWRNQRLEVSSFSGTLENPITFSAYPEIGLEKPIFTTIIEHEHTWTNQGGNLWKAINPPNFHPDRVWVDGEELLRGNSLEELDDINFLWLYDSDENGDFYLHSNTNPINKTIEYTSGIVNIIIEDANYITFSNLDLQGGWTSIFLLDNVSNILIKDSNIGKNASTGIDINSDAAFNPNQITITNNSFDANFTLDYSMAGTYRGSDDRGCSDGIFMQSATNCQISNNYFKNWGHSSINVDGNPFEGTTVKVSNIVVNDNYMTSPDIIYGGRMAVDDAFNCEVYNNQIIQTSVQTQLGGYDNHYHHNIIDGTTNPTIVENSDEISVGISVETYSNTDIYNNIYEHNLIKDTEGAGFRFTNNGLHDIRNNKIQNNILFNCGSVDEETNIGIRIEEDTTDCHTYDNIFSNNLVYNENTSNTINFRETITNINGFNALNGVSNYQISANISGNPLFIDSNSDYHLTIDSPCINTGKITDLTQDFDGNPLPFGSTLPDIGLYEYQALVSINSFFNDSNILVFPNPSNNEINITTDTFTQINNISIYDTSGKLIKNNIFQDKPISIADLNSGLYILKIETLKKSITLKIIKR